MDDPLTKKCSQEEAEAVESSSRSSTLCNSKMAVAVVANGHCSSDNISSSAIQLAETSTTSPSSSPSHEQHQEGQEQQQQCMTSTTTTTLEEVADNDAAATSAAAATMTMSVTMEEVGHLMREQDADLLESHHARGANETNTVLLAPPPPPPPPPALLGVGGGSVGGGGATATTCMHSSSSLGGEQQIPLARQLSADGSSRSILKGGAASAIALAATTPTSTPIIRKRAILHRSSSRATSEGSVHQQQQQPDGSGIISMVDPQQLQVQQQVMIEAQFLKLQQQQPLSPRHHHQRRPTLSGQIFEHTDGASSVASAGPMIGSTTAGITAVSHGSAAAGTTTGAAMLNVSALSIHTTGGGGGGADVIDPYMMMGGSVCGGDASSSVHGVDNNLLDGGSSSIKPFGRTESMERRLNEMAQFAEAVGIDVPSTIELRINDDEDHDDDDDSTEAAFTVSSTTVAAAAPAAITTAAAAASPTPTTVEGSNSQKRVSIVVPTEAAAGSYGSTANGLILQQQSPIETLERQGSSDRHVASPRHHRLQPSSDAGVLVGGEVAIPAIEGGGPQTVVPAAAITTTRQKIRPPWPFRINRGFLDQLPDSNKQQDFTYKGIHANPPEIVKSGSQRGNYAQLHRKAWLEVSDKYHRYGKNLRLYYRYWERLGFPTNSFFEWLDSKGEAAGQPLPELEDCPRATLDADTVLYITNPDISQRYAVSFHPDPATGRGRVVDVDGEIVATGPDGWIFVLRDNVVYGAPKITSATPGHLSKQRFHHSSFFGGKAVAAAGIFITDDEGFLTRLYPHSGHYRPGEAHIQRMLFYMHQTGVDLRTFEMDMQQILHVAREKDKNKENNADGGMEKKKKIESLYLMPAVIVACYLAHKARFIGQGIFTQIHRIARTEATNVTEALELIDGDGLCSSDMPPWLMDQG